MVTKLTVVKHVWIRITVALLAIAAAFGWRCPVEGCPACKLLGK